MTRSNTKDSLDQHYVVRIRYHYSTTWFHLHLHTLFRLFDHHGHYPSYLRRRFSNTHLRRSLQPYASKLGILFTKICVVKNMRNKLLVQCALHHHHESVTATCQTGLLRPVNTLLPMGTQSSATAHAHNQTLSNA